MKKNIPCTCCGSIPTSLVRERIPGSQGNMAQSFADEYRLCSVCLERVRRAGAICNVDSERGRHEERFTVYGKTFAWLKTQKESK